MSSAMTTLPLPLVGSTRIQASLDDAVHVHPGDVVSVMDPPVESLLRFRVDGLIAYEHAVPTWTTRAVCRAHQSR